MRYLSVCSGIEAASVAWHPLGWEAAAFSDIDAFPRAVLRHRYPDVPLHGRDRERGEKMEDYAEEAGFQTIQGDEYGHVDLLVGGTPCQSFSIAGLRGGLDDQRGNLSLEYVKLAYRLGARWCLWENVPAVFSSDDGRAFQSILSGLANVEVTMPRSGWKSAGVVAPGPGGYGLAWRVLDAQYVRSHGHQYATPQRRRRVFLVGCIGDWRRAAAVLFEPQGMRGDSSPRREEEQGVAKGFETGPGGNRFTDVSPTLDTGAADGPMRNQLAAGVLAFNSRQDPLVSGSITGSLDTRSPQAQAVVFQQNSRSEVRLVGGDGQSSGALAACHGAQQQNYVLHNVARRLTPTECERLQRFPDGYTQVPYRGRAASNCPDGPRYKALGNSMAVNVMAWIGQRIQLLVSMEPKKPP